MELLYKSTKVFVEARCNKYEIQATHTQKEGPIMDSLCSIIYIFVYVITKPSATPEKQEKINTKSMSKELIEPYKQNIQAEKRKILASINAIRVPGKHI